MRFCILALIVGCTSAAPGNYHSLGGYGGHTRRSSYPAYKGGDELRNAKKVEWPKWKEGLGHEVQKEYKGQHGGIRRRHILRRSGIGDIINNLISFGNKQIAFNNKAPIHQTYGGTQRSKVNCGPHMVANPKGICVSNSMFYFEPPRLYSYYDNNPPVAQIPKVNYNVVFVYTPEATQDPEKVVLSPSQQKTIIYVVSKKQSAIQQVIQAPEFPKEKPEVFYVNYNEHDNPIIAGLPLQQLLNSGTGKALDGVVVGGGRGGTEKALYVDTGTESNDYPTYLEAESNTPDAVFVNTEGETQEAPVSDDDDDVDVDVDVDDDGNESEVEEPIFINVNRKGEIK